MKYALARSGYTFGTVPVNGKVHGVLYLDFLPGNSPPNPIRDFKATLSSINPTGRTTILLVSGTNNNHRRRDVDHRSQARHH